jgi:hypothetical protein
MPRKGANSSVETLIDQKDDTCRYLVTRAGTGYLATILWGDYLNPTMRAEWPYRTEDAARRA